MVLENFLVDADILWDRAGKELYEKPEARAGRKMRVRVTNRGVVEDLTGYTLNLGWKSTVDETKFGLDAFVAVDITKGIFEIEYTSGMLTNIGTLKAALQLVPTVGNTVESNNFVITVTRSAVDTDAIQSESSFTALTSALVEVNGWNARIDDVEQQFIDKANNLDATYPTRLVSVEQQLEQNELTKIGDGVLATMNDLSQEVKTAMTGGSVAVVGVGAVLTETVVDKQITAPKTDFIKTGKNLFDKTKALASKSVNYATGNLSDNASYFTYYQMPVKPGDLIAISTSGQIAYHNVSKVYVSGLAVIYPTDAPRLITIPAGVYYLTVSSPYTISIDKFQIEYGTASTTYEPYQLVIDKQIVSNENIKLRTVTEDKLAFPVPEMVLSKNLADAKYLVEGYYINETTGSIVANVNHDLYHKIPITPGTTFAISGDVLTTLRVVYHGSNEARLSNEPYPSGTIITAPAGAYFLSFSLGYANLATVQLEIGTVATAYVAPGYTLPSLQTDSAPLEEVLAFLPSEISVAVGRTLEIYNRQAVWAGNLNNYHIKWVAAIGKSMRRKWEYTATADKVGTYPLTLTVYDNNMNVVATASTTIKVVAATIETAINLLPIGDSLSNAKPWLGEVRTLSSNQIRFVGTRWNGDVQGGNLNHEGRSGASANWYLQNLTYTFDTNGVSSANPFYNTATSSFDYAYYKTTYGITPNAIQIYLGTNTIALDPTANANNIKMIVDKIRLADATIPIFLVFTLYRGDQDGIGKQLSTDGYSAGSGVWKLEEDRKVFNLMVRLNDLLKNYTDLHFVPIALTHDSEFNFKDITTPVLVNSRSTITEIQDKEATHPVNPGGYLQMADIIFSTMCAYL